jgi:hypothetical protein
LHDEGAEFPLVKVAYSAAYITDPFNCRDKYQYGEGGDRWRLKEGEQTEAANDQGDEVVGFFPKR